MEKLSVRAAVAYLQQKYGYSSPFPGRNVRNWLKSGALAGELTEPVPGWHTWMTTDAAIDEAWRAGRIPPQMGQPAKFEVVKENRILMAAYQNVISGGPDCWDHVSSHRTRQAAERVARRLAKTDRCQIRDDSGQVIAWGCNL